MRILLRLECLIINYCLGDYLFDEKCFYFLVYLNICFFVWGDLVLYIDIDIVKFK